MSVEFIQYLRPDGRKEQIYIDLGPEYDVIAKQIKNDGYTLEAEVLMTGQVSFTITAPECDLWHRICSNGPVVLDTVRQLLDAYSKQEALDRIKAFEEA